MIEIKNLVKCYGNHAAVNDLSFTVETGKVVGFLGPNGAGKSTTMNMITGYIAPTSGTVLIDGIDILEEPEKAKARIGYLPEIPPLYPDLRVREYLQFVAELKKITRKERDKSVYQVMKKTMTTEVSDRLIRHLSKGYKQRVGLAGAMLGEPDILILDEPTVGLDPGQIIEIRELIRELSKERTVLLSSHIMQEISAVCDEIIIINNGKMIASDTPENLTRKMVQGNDIYLEIKGDSEQIEKAVQSVNGIEQIVYEEGKVEGGCCMTISASRDIREEIFFAMAGNSCPILEMHSLHTTLEDAFLALTEGSTEIDEIAQQERSDTEAEGEDKILEAESSKEEIEVKEITNQESLKVVTEGKECVEKGGEE